MVRVGSFDLNARLKDVSKIGDYLEKLDKIIDCGKFRKPLEIIGPRKNKCYKERTSCL